MKTLTLSSTAEATTVAVRVDDTDLAALAAGKTGTINLLSVPLGMAVELKGMVLREPFTFTEANGTLLATVGDGGTADVYLGSTELWSTGAIDYAVGAAGYAYTAADTVDLFLTTDDDGSGPPPVDYNLNSADAGEVWFYFTLRDLSKAPNR